MKTRRIDRCGVELTELGFGAAGIGNLHRPTNNKVADDAVQEAWRLGIRYFDTAPHYGAGLSERRIGLALNTRPNDRFLLSTKAGRLLVPAEQSVPLDSDGYMQAAPFNRKYDYSYDGIMRSFEDSQQRLGTPKIDILFMHDIGHRTHGDRHAELFRTAMDSGFKAMAELRDQGLVKAIGLGVNEWQVCEESMPYADFDCFMVANCFTLLDNAITDHFTEKCAKNNVSLISAAPFSSGVLAKGSSGAGTYFYDVAPQEVIERVIALEQVCSEYEISLAAAAIQFPLQYSCVKSVVVGMTSPERIRQNIDWYNQDIPLDFWEALCKRGYVTSL